MVIDQIRVGPPGTKGGVSWPAVLVLFPMLHLTSVFLIDTQSTVVRLQNFTPHPKSKCVNSRARICHSSKQTFEVWMMSIECITSLQIKDLLL